MIPTPATIELFASLTTAVFADEDKPGIVLPFDPANLTDATLADVIQSNIRAADAVLAELSEAGPAANEPDEAQRIAAMELVNRKSPTGNFVDIHQARADRRLELIARILAKAADPVETGGTAPVGDTFWIEEASTALNDASTALIKVRTALNKALAADLAG
jgi:hypothetical protein